MQPCRGNKELDYQSGKREMDGTIRADHSEQREKCNKYVKIKEIKEIHEC